MKEEVQKTKEAKRYFFKTFKEHLNANIHK